MDEDFAWVTAAILASCARVTAALGSQQVRYLSVLEGGYDIPAIQRCAVLHVEEMLRGLPELPSEGPSSSSTTAQEGEVEKEDGELVALREYLEAFGIDDTKPK